VHGVVQEVLETSGADEISLFGQSQGGTLCDTYAPCSPEVPSRRLAVNTYRVRPKKPGGHGVWTIASRSSGVYFDPAMVSKIFGNLPTDLASQMINSIASQQATVVGLAARPFALTPPDAQYGAT
jgi:hypothetical protein